MRFISFWVICAVTISTVGHVQTQMNNIILGSLVPLFRVPSPTTGSFVVTVNAPLENVPYSRTAVLKFGLTNCPQTFWLSITTLQCKSTAKHFNTINSNLTISVSVVFAQTYNPDPKYFRQDYGNLSQHFYQVVRLKNVVLEISNGSTEQNLFSISASSGSMPVIFSGEFGLSDASQSTRKGSTSGTISLWISHSTLLCRFSKGIGFTTVSLSVEQRVSSMSACIRYDATAVFGNSTSWNAPATGSVLYPALGNGMGLAGYSFRLNVGFSASESSKWFSDTSFVAKFSTLTSSTSISISVFQGAEDVATLSRGFGLIEVLSRDYLIRDAISTVSHSSSYDCPRLKVLSDLILCSTSSKLIKVQAIFYSTFDSTVSIKASQSALQSSAWTSDTSIVIKFGHIGVRSILLRTTIDLHGSSCSSSSLKSAPILLPTNTTDIFSTTGAQIVTLLGKSFGIFSYSPSSKSGLSSCFAQNWVSDSSMSSKMPQGSMGPVYFSVSVNLLASSIASNMTPSMMYTLGSVVNSIDASIPTTASFRTHIYVSEFSKIDASCKSRLTPSANEATLWTSDSSIGYQVFASNVYLGIIQATVGRQKGMTLSAGPKVSGITLLTEGLALPASGSSALIVFGSLFGSHRISAKIRIGLSSQASTNWVSDSSVQPKSGSGTFEKKITAFFILSVMQVIRSTHFPKLLNSAAISSQYLVIHPATGSVSMSAYGQSFLPFRQSLSTKIGWTASPVTTWLSDSHTAFKLPLRNSINVSATVSVGWHCTPAAAFIAVQLPQPFSIITSMPSSGALRLLIYGNGASSCDLSPAVKLVVTVAQLNIWRSDSIIVCKSALGSGRLKEFGLSVASSRAFVNFESFYNMSLAVSSVSSFNLSSSGSFAFFIWGSALGLCDASQRVRLRHSSPSSSAWISDSAIHVKTFAGSSKLTLLIFSTGAHRNDLSHFSFTHHPLVANGTYGNLITTGSQKITIQGIHLGVSILSVKVGVGTTFCEWTMWTSSSFVACKIGTFSQLQAVFLTVASFRSQGNSLHIFPVLQNISSLAEIGHPGTGASLHFFAGIRFGRQSLSIASQLDTSTCSASFWHSDTKITCKAPSRFLEAASFVSVSLPKATVVFRRVRASPQPRISSSFPCNGPSTGSVFITVAGSAFGCSSPSSSLLIGSNISRPNLAYTRCLSVVWSSDSSVVCKVPRGLGNQLFMSISLQENLGSQMHVILTRVYSYDSPHLLQLQTTGLLSTIMGQNFGQYVTTVDTHGGFIGSAPYILSRNSTSVIANLSTFSLNQHERIIDILAEVEFSNITAIYDMLLFIQGPKGQLFSLLQDSCNGCISSSVLYRFDPSAKSQIPSSFCEPSGVFQISFEKDNFLNTLGPGLNAIGLWQLMLTTAEFGISVTSAKIILRTQRFNVLMGFTIASSFDWTSDSSVLGQSYMGIGTRKPLTVIASDLRSPDSSNIKLSFPRHLVSANNISVLGSSFSADSSCCTVDQGCFLCNVTGASQVCAMQYHPDSFCGRSATDATSITRTACCGTLPAAACISCQQNFPVIYCAPTTGSAIIWGFGLEFGFVTLSLMAKIGPTACAHSNWLSSSSVLCKSQQGISKLIPFSITIGSSGEAICESVTKAFSYSLARDFNVMRNQGSSISAKTGNFLAVVRGREFGHHGSTSAFRLQASSAATSFWSSETMLSLKAGVTHSDVLSLKYSIGLQSIVILSSFAIVNFSLGSDSAMELVPTSGSVYLQTSGFNIGSSAYSALCSKLGLSSSSFTAWQSDSAAYLKSPSGLARTTILAMTQFRIVSGISQFASYNNHSANHVRIFSDMLIPQSGSLSLSLSGTDFGIYRHTITFGRIGRSSFLSTIWISDSTIRAKCPAGYLQGLSVVVSHIRVLSIVPQVVDYLPPNASSVKSYSGHLMAKSGSKSITLWGSNFGSHQRSLKGHVGPSSTLATSWIAGTSVSLKHSAGYGRDIALVLTQTLKVSKALQLMNFTYFSAQRIVYLSLPSTGSESLVFVGKDFGGLDISLFASRTANSISETTKWKSDSAALLKSCSGFTRYGNVVLTQGFLSRAVFFQISYATSTISYVQESEIPCTGRFLVHVSGFNLLKLDMSQTIRVGESSNQFSHWISDSSVLLKTASGAGLNRVFISADNQMWSIKSFFSYSVLQKVRTLLPINAPSTGATSSTINGAMFGVDGYSISGRFGGTATEAVAWMSDSHVVLKTPTCLDRSPSLSISVLIQTSTILNLSLFDKPESPITARVVLSNAATTSIAMITISGSGLGRADQTQASRLQDTGAALTRWRSESSVRCRMISGTSFGLALVFSLNPLLLDRISRTFTFDIKIQQLLGSTVTKMPNSGSLWIEILSSNKGTFDSSLSLSVGFSDTERTFWEADSQIRSKLAVSSSFSVVLTLSCSGQLSRKTSAFSFSNIATTTIRPQNMPATGFVVLVANGMSYGANGYCPYMRFGSTSATSTDWISASAILSKCPSGLGSGQFSIVGVSNQMQSALMFNGLSYNIPSMSSLVFHEGFSATITGKGFGTFATGRIFSSDTLIPIWVPPGTSVILAENDISSLQNGFLLFSLSIVVELVNFTRLDDISISVIHPSGQSSKLFGSQCFGCYGGYMKLTFVDGPMAAPQNNCPVDGSHGAATSLNNLLTSNSFGIWKLLLSTGSTSLTILSASIDIFASSLISKFSGSPAESLTWTSDTFFNTLAPKTGAGKNRHIVVLAATQQSVQNFLFTYPTPIVTGLSHLLLSTTASSVLSISGVYFSAAQTTINARTAGSSCGGSMWVSQSSIRCRLSSGIRPGFSTSATVNELRNSMSTAFTYVQPAAASVLSVSLASSGSQFLYIRGVAFAVYAPSPAYRAGLTAASSSLWISDSSVNFKIVSLSPSALQFVATFNRIRRMESKIEVSTKDPVISSIFMNPSSNIPVSGSFFVVFQGSYFGKVSKSSSIRVGFSGCTRSLWMSDSAMLCKSTSSVPGFVNPLVLSLGLIRPIKNALELATNTAFSDGSFCEFEVFEYNPDQVMSRYLGRNFGLVDYSPAFIIAGTPCPNPEWISQSSINCIFRGKLPIDELILYNALRFPAVAVEQIISYANPSFIPKDVQMRDALGLRLNIPASSSLERPNNGTIGYYSFFEGSIYSFNSFSMSIYVYSTASQPFLSAGKFLTIPMVGSVSMSKDGGNFFDTSSFCGATVFNQSLSFLSGRKDAVFIFNSLVICNTLKNVILRFHLRANDPRTLTPVSFTLDSPSFNISSAFSQIDLVVDVPSVIKSGVLNPIGQSRRFVANLLTFVDSICDSISATVFFDMVCSKIADTKFFVLGNLVSKRYAMNLYATCSVVLPAWSAILADSSCYFEISVENTNLAIQTQKFKILPGSPDVFRVNGTIPTNLTCGDQIWSAKISSDKKCLIFQVYDNAGNLYNYDKETFIVSGISLDQNLSASPYFFPGTISTEILNGNLLFCNISAIKLSTNVRIILTRLQNQEHSEHIVVTPHSFRVPYAAPAAGISRSLIINDILAFSALTPNSSTNFFVSHIYSNVTLTNSTFVSARTVAGKPLPYFSLLFVDSFGNPLIYDPQSSVVLMISFVKHRSRHLLQSAVDESCDGGGDVFLRSQPIVIGNFVGSRFVVDNFIPCSASSGVVSYSIGEMSSNGVFSMLMPDVFQIELIVIIGTMELFILRSNAKVTEVANAWFKTDLEINILDAGRNSVIGIVELRLVLKGTNQSAATLGNSLFKVSNVSKVKLPKVLLVWVQFYPTESVSSIILDGFTIPSLRNIGSPLPFTLSALCIPGFQLNLNTSQYQDSLAGNCSRCAPGWITRNYDEFICTICPIGFVSNAENNLCIQCQGNSVAIRPGASVCTPCADGFIASPNSTSCLRLRFQSPPPTHLISRHQVLIPKILLEVDGPSNPNVMWFALINNHDITLTLVCNPNLLCSNIQNIPFSLKLKMNSGSTAPQQYVIPSDMQQEIGENLFWTISVDQTMGILDIPAMSSTQERYPVYVVGENPVIEKIDPITASVFGDEKIVVGGRFFVVDIRRIKTLYGRQICSFNSTSRLSRQAALDFYTASNLNHSFTFISNSSNTSGMTDSKKLQTLESNHMSHMDFESLATATPPPVELVCDGPDHGYTFETWNVYVWFTDYRNSLDSVFTTKLELYCPKRFWVSLSELQHHCLECPRPMSATTQRNSMKLNDCICDVKHYGTFGLGCIECPSVDGFDCSGIGESRPTIFPGYYIIYNEMSLCIPGGDVCSAITKCAYAHSCPGRTEKDCFGGPDEAECYTGKSCQLCCKKYFRNQQDCFQCPPPNNILTAFIAAGAVMAALALLIFVSNTPALGAVVKRVSMLLVFLQGLISFQSLKINWPPFVYALFESLRSVSFSLDVVRPECALDLSLLQKNLIMVSLPIFLSICVIILAIIYSVHCSIKIRDMIRNLDSDTVVSLRHTQLSDILELLKTTVLFLDISKKVGSASTLWLILNPQLRNRVKLRAVRTAKQNWAALKMKWKSRRIIAQFLGKQATVVQKPEEYEEVRFIIQQAHIDVKYDLMANSVRRLMSAIFAVFIVTYTGVLGVAFSVFSCIKYGDDMVLVLNPEMKCDLNDPTYLQLYIVSGISIIAYGAVYPFFQFTLMRSKWCRNMFYQERSGWEMCFGFIVNQYNPQNYQWEVVQLIRKAVPLVASVLFTNAIEQTVTGLIVALMYFGSLLAKQPYADKSLNSLETAQSCVALMFIFSALLYVIEDEEGNRLLNSTGIFWLSLVNVFSVFGTVLWNIISGFFEFRFHRLMHRDKNVSLWLQAFHAEAGDVINPESSGTIFEALFVASQSVSRDHIVAARERTAKQQASLTTQAQNQMLQIETSHPWVPKFVLRMIAAKKKRAIQKEIDDFILKQQLTPDVLQRFRESPEVSFLLALRKIGGRVQELHALDAKQGTDFKQNQVSAEGTRKTWERIGPNDPPYEYAREVSDVAEYLQTTFSTNTLHFLLVYMIFREQLLACDQDPEGIRYAKKFDLATRGLLATIQKFRVMKSIVMRKTRLEILKNKYVFAFKIFGKDVFDSVLDLMSLKSLSEMDLEEVNGKKSAHQVLEEAAQAQMMEQSQKLEDIRAKQQLRADFLAGIKAEKKEIVVVDTQQGPPVVKKPAFLRRVITAIKPRKEDITPMNSGDTQPAAPADSADRPKVRMSLAQVQAMLLDQSLEVRESINLNGHDEGNTVQGEDSAAGVAALARETGQDQEPRPPTGASQLMRAMGSVRAKLRASSVQSAPLPPPRDSEQM